MSTQTLQQGGLRPARTPAIAVVHPGLQVHSIAPPATDRRLSLLMSATVYCAFAAGVVLVAQASPAIRKPWVKSEPDPVLVELRPLDAPPIVVTPVAHSMSNNLPFSTANTPTITEPQPVVDTSVLPTSVGTTDVSAHIAGYPSSTQGTGGTTAVGALPPGTLTGPDSGQPMEVSYNAVRVLEQIQPAYPALARMAHKEGDVVLIMTINEHGVPTDVKVDSGEAIFRNDAVRAAQQWRFTPANLGGQPHSARFRLTLQFRLRG